MVSLDNIFVHIAAIPLPSTIINEAILEDEETLDEEPTQKAASPQPSKQSTSLYFCIKICM